jgi:hypothetical protein
VKIATVGVEIASTTLDGSLSRAYNAFMGMLPVVVEETS